MRPFQPPSRLCRGEVNLSRKILIDIWDHDAGRAPDFMGYLEITLQGLVDAAREKTALQVKPPPSEKGKVEDAGRLYVESATLGFPQVVVHACVFPQCITFLFLLLLIR